MSDIKLKTIKKIIESISNYRGEDYFNQITRSLDESIDSDYTFIAKFDKEKYSSKTISLVAKGEIIENMEYALNNTPCSEVFENSVCLYPKDVCNFYTKDQLLIDMNISGYIGTPLVDSSGEVIGIIVALYEKEIVEREKVKALFQLFSGRIVAELEREEYEAALKEMNENLDNKVKERTKELEINIEKLKQAQNQLIESEKMTSIAVLVKGIAHEVNTPLGISITTNSLIQENMEKIESGLESKTLSFDKLVKYKNNIKEAVKLQTSNLNKSKELIDKFKKTSVEQYVYVQESIKLKERIKELVSTMSYKMKNIEVEVNGIEDKVNTFLSVHYQILSNLMLNSSIHAFKEEDENKKIVINISHNEEGYSVDYQDNGSGIPKENLQKVFDPFFTTGRGIGCSGLGLYVIYNLVNQKLKGNVEIKDSKKGMNLIYNFKEL
jgi:two-component system NtrC family sensor kinase